MTPAHIQSHKRVSCQCRITQNLFISAIEKIFDSQHQGDRGTELIAAAQIDLLISRISYNPETDSIGILALSHERSVQVHETAAKACRHIHRTGMTRTAW